WTCASQNLPMAQRYSRRRENFLPPRDPGRAIRRPVGDKKRLPQVGKAELIIAIKRNDPLHQWVESRRRPDTLFVFARVAIDAAADLLQERRRAGVVNGM